jgi:hypothetical protein
MPTCFVPLEGRGRDAGYPAPPAQIPACGTTAPGSCLGSNAQALRACRTQSCACDRVTRLCVRPLWNPTRFPLASPLLSTPSASSGAPEPLFEGFFDTMGLSDSLHPSITVVPLRFPVRTWRSLVRPDAGSPGFRTQCFYACQRSPTPPGPSPPCQNGVDSIAFRVFGARRHPGLPAISGLNTLPACSPVNASPAPLPTPAHDSGPVWLAKPSLSGTYTLQHYAGLSRRLPERPR